MGAPLPAVCGAPGPWIPGPMCCWGLSGALGCSICCCACLGTGAAKGRGPPRVEAAAAAAVEPLVNRARDRDSRRETERGRDNKIIRDLLCFLQGLPLLLLLLLQPLQEYACHQQQQQRRRNLAQEGETEGTEKGHLLLQGLGLSPPLNYGRWLRWRPPIGHGPPCRDTGRSKGDSKSTQVSPNI